MAEVFDFGLQQHKIKMDGKFFESNLFAVAGDTGRRLEVQLLDSNNMVQNTTGISLRLNANVAGQATYAEATLVDATKGLYELDLPNGMLIAPGNWQFQWQIIGTSGEKLHSFAFTGSVGSNLSEGGSEATNFYLNVDELKQMQEDLINGTFNSEVLETNIAEKLNNLETQYAPKLAEVTAQLDQKAIEEITNSTKFNRSKIAINAYWGDYDFSTGNAVWVASKAQVEGQINQFVGLIDEIVVVLHLIYNKAGDTFEFIESVENLQHGVEYAKTKGIATSAIKLHCDIPESLMTSYGKEAFWSVYNSKVDELCNAFSANDIAYFIPFNEQNHLYKSDSAYLSNVHSVIQRVKNNGYKVTMTTNNTWDFLSLSSDTINRLDALSVNLYPNLSSKLDKTTLEDSILGWNQYVPFFEHLKSFGKPVFVSEFGCVDNWQALASTGGWSFDEAFKGYGMAQEICYRGFFKSTIPQYIDSAWIWFYQSIPSYPYVPQTLKSYRGGSL